MHLFALTVLAVAAVLVVWLAAQLRRDPVPPVPTRVDPGDSAYAGGITAGDLAEFSAYCDRLTAAWRATGDPS